LAFRAGRSKIVLGMTQAIGQLFDAALEVGRIDHEALGVRDQVSGMISGIRSPDQNLAAET